MRATALVLLAGAAAALQPTLRVHAARPVRTSGNPVQKTMIGINDLLANRFQCLHALSRPARRPPPRTGDIVQPPRHRADASGGVIVDTHTGIVARAEPEREDGMVDIRPQPRELDSDAELGLTVLAPGIALFALIAVVAQFAHPV